MRALVALALDALGVGPRVALRAVAALLALGLLTSGCVMTTVAGDQARESTPGEKAEARRNVGIDHLVNGRTAMAIRELKHAVTLNPADPVSHHWLGEAYRRRGLLAPAEEHISLALDSDPSYHEVRLSLSALYIQMKRYEESIEHARVLVDDPVFSTPWRALTNIGWAQLQLGQRAEARVSLEDALDFSPRYWPARLNLGILESVERNHVAAMDHFQAVLELGLGGGAEAEVNFRMAEIYVSLGRRDEALRHFEVALEQSPHGRWGKRSKEYMRLLR